MLAVGRCQASEPTDADPEEYGRFVRAKYSTLLSWQAAEDSDEFLGRVRSLRLLRSNDTLEVVGSQIKLLTSRNERE